MPTKLTWHAGPRAGVIVLGDEPVLIGRAGGCDLRIKNDARLDRRHARIHHEGGRYSITDLDSKHGTWVNGRRIEEPHPLGHRDRIECGELRLECFED